MIRFQVNPARVRPIKTGGDAVGAVLYWMSRDQRVEDNWALLYAQQLALACKSPVAIAFCLAPGFLGATTRHYEFMLRGLAETSTQTGERGIPFALLSGAPEVEIPRFIERFDIRTLITDFSPLRISRTWQRKVAAKISIPFFSVDAHNIVPVWAASDRQEFAAYTIRPKIRKLLPEFLDEFPKVKRHPFPWPKILPKPDWRSVRKSLRINDSVAEDDWVAPGEKAGLKVLSEFLDKRLKHYDTARNNPVKNGQSGLSPYLHFGQISAQRVAWETQRFDRHAESQEAFLEELIIRRELADNFCYYNTEYDSVSGFPEWSRNSLKEHSNDPRPHIYAADELEEGITRDDLWNAAQREMVSTGKMHGYLRMYWAKKILEWMPSPEQAYETAIYLNDRYELDGRDPNGYAGLAWSIGGLHDRPWFERDIFGKVRYMSRAGCDRKFDVKAYIAKHIPSGPQRSK
jgi:deoxyribodipyrimidine photo-lyase